MLVNIGIKFQVKITSSLPKIASGLSFILTKSSHEKQKVRLAKWSRALTRMRTSERSMRGLGVRISVEPNVFYPIDGAPCSFFYQKLVRPQLTLKGMFLCTKFW